MKESTMGIKETSPASETVVGMALGMLHRHWLARHSVEIQKRARPTCFGKKPGQSVGSSMLHSRTLAREHRAQFAKRARLAEQSYSVQHRRFRMHCVPVERRAAWSLENSTPQHSLPCFRSWEDSGQSDRHQSWRFFLVD